VSELPSLANHHASPAAHHQSPDTSLRRFRTGAPCRECGRPVLHSGNAQRFCTKACSDIGKLLLADSEVAAIVSARRSGIPWTVIASDLSVSVATCQRSCWRAGADIDVPTWIAREGAP
jgi:hypothetical protein